MKHKFTNPFKSSKVQGFNRILFGVLFLTLELLNPLNLEPAAAQTPPFYQDKTVRIVIGFTPGGFYDRWARLLSRYMPKYIPGNPNFLVQNMPGASSVIAANYVYNLSQGRRPDAAGADQQSLSRSNGWTQRSEVRRAQIRIHRHPRKSADHALFPRRQSVQNPERHHQRQRAAEMRLHRHGQHRLLARQDHGRSLQSENGHRHRLSGRQ